MGQKHKKTYISQQMLRKSFTQDLLILLLATLFSQSSAFLPRSRHFAVSSSTVSPSRCLFFKATEAPKKPGFQIPEQVFADFASNNVTLPYQCELETTISDENRLLTIRLLQSKDLERISDMCYQEYSTGPATFFNFPWQTPAKIEDWLERLMLRPLVDLTMRLKLHDNDIADDYAVIVACFNDTIAGMVEVNRQPVLPERNPPPYPIPLVLKQVYCQLAKLEPPQAWIANLLVAPEFRGRGLSKVLVAACECIARSSWNLQSIHLHCDADSASGGIPQKLYESMGYERIADPNPEYAWLSTMMSTSIYMIDGVPLLYLRKKL